mmetsp:Transcript_46418/g.110594  ORF Transcript_46418/g.110594 Transcript_46418/m.110594 type:complete len:165 (+) Transcript_46418:110-604(+)
MSPVFQNAQKHFEAFLLKNRAAAKAWDTALAGVASGKAITSEATGKGFGIMYEHLNPIAVDLVTKFETAMPEYKGAVRKSLGDFTIAAVYFGMVLYVLFRVLFWMLRKTFAILSYVLCCRCCKSKKTAKKGKNKAPAASNAADRGKAAAAKPAAKDQAKAKAKK